MSLLLSLSLLTAATDSVAAPAPETVQPASASITALSAASEELENRIKVLERLREVDIEEAEAAAKAAPKVQADAGGFWIRSADSAWQFRPRALVRLGANWDLNDENDKTTDQFQAQTVRLGFDATLAKFVEAKVLLDISKGNGAALQDGYLDVKLESWLRGRVGKFQVPLGWERNISPADLAFYDRALPSQIAPNRDIGAQAWGQIAGGVAEYAVGLFNGGADGSNIDKDVNDDKDLYARVWLQPARKSGNEWFEGLGLGVGGSYGFHTASLTSGYKTTSGSTFFTWNAADTSNGQAWRIAPQLAWTAGSFSLFGEWIRSVENIRRGVAATATDSVGTGSANKGVVYRVTKTTAGLPELELAATAWQAGASWVITGEDAAFAGGVKPRHPFGKDGGLGAFEIAARISQLSVDDDAFQKGYADSLKSARSALAWGVSLNWHLIKGTRVQVGFERTDFEQGAAYNDAKGKATIQRDRKSENQLFVISSTNF